MLVCVPTVGYQGFEDSVCEHFGRAQTFTLVDSVTKEVRVVENKSEHMGGTGTPPEHLAKEGVKVVLAGGLGPKAIDMLHGYGIIVFVGAHGTVQQAIVNWETGKLASASKDNACRDHAH